MHRLRQFLIMFKVSIACLLTSLIVFIPLVGASAFGMFNFDVLLQPDNGTRSYETKRIEIERIKLQATINVRYIDTYGNDIGGVDTYVVDPGAYGPFVAKQINGYGYLDLAIGSDPSSGVIRANEEKTIVFQYAKHANINLMYIDLISGKVLGEENIIVSPGNYGPYNAKDFSSSGYIYVGLAPWSANIVGNIWPGDTITIVYRYITLTTGTINVEYYDPLYDFMLWSETLIIPVGSYGPYAPIDYSYLGYANGIWDSTSDPTTGTIKGGQELTIRFLYFFR